jgi:preprotein translocase subunit SecG
MQVLWTLVQVLQIVSALSMIGLVLVQHGKGADMGASFGSGASGSLFGATGSANFLSRSTAVAATLFFLATLGLAYAGNHHATATDAPSVFDQPASAAAAASATASAAAAATTAAKTASGAALIPTK